MFFLAPAILLCVLLGCSGIGKDTVAYIGNSNEVQSAPTPNGFSISPAEAKEIVQKHRGPKKTIDDYYADDGAYYVVDGFAGSKPQNARDFGIKINGTTGEIFDRETNSWLPNPRIDNPSAASQEPIAR